MNKNTRHKHVKRCLERQKAENAFLINDNRFKMLEAVERDEYVANAGSALSCFDYEGLLEVVRVDVGRGKSRLAFLTRWKDSLNDVVDSREGNNSGSSRSWSCLFCNR